MTDQFADKVRAILAKHQDETDESILDIEKHTGIDRNILYRFRKGDQGLSSENLVRLMEFLEMEISDLS